MRRYVLGALWLIIAVGMPASPLAIGSQTETENRPNVLLVLTDDQGFGDVSSHGNPWIRTPNHDRIAAEGVRFDRFFVSPVCAPTRASLLTGRWHLRTGVHGVTRGFETMRSGETTIAELFEAAGYVTGAFGKWHNGAHLPQHPNGQGFGTFYGFCSGHWNNYFDTKLERNGLPVRGRGFIIDDLTTQAIRFMDASRDQPFFCYLPMNTPHTPWQVPDQFWDRWKDRRDLTPEARCAYAMCENIDVNLGRLLDYLAARKLDRETIVIFLTDNGANSNRFNAGMRGRKGSLHEGGSRVPLFIRWPGNIPPGRTIDRIAAHIDLFPTLAELAGIPVPAELQLDGRSLVSLWKESSPDWTDRVLYTHWGDGPDGLPNPYRGAVRTQRWRAVQERPGQWQLFDMLLDPGQKSNVAEKHSEVAVGLARQFNAWFKDVCADGFEAIPVTLPANETATVTLPGHEAFLMTAKGNVRRGEEQKAGISYVGRAGWANDWVTGWTRADAWAQWNIHVPTSGRFRVKLNYSCADTHTGGRLRVECLGQNLEAVIEKAHDPEPLPSPDRIVRKEVLEKEWATADFGILELPRGTGVLRIRGVQSRGGRFPDVKSIALTRIEP